MRVFLGRSRRTDRLGLRSIWFSLLLLPLMPAVNAEAILGILSENCSEVGCCALAGATIEATLMTMPESDAVAAFQLSVSYDPTQLRLESVSEPGSGPFAEVPLEASQSQGVVTIAGLNCGGADPGIAVNLARLTFSVLSAFETATPINLAGATLLDSDRQPVAVELQDRTFLISTEPDADCDQVVDSVDNCPDVFNPDQDPHACDMLFVSIDHFEAIQIRPRVVEVRWSTVLEIDHFGFNLYRAALSTGPWTKVNDRLVRAAGTPFAGAVYSQRDRIPQSLGDVVFYKLEDVDVLGRSTELGPISIVLRVPPTKPRTLERSAPAGGRTTDGSESSDSGERLPRDSQEGRR